MKKRILQVVGALRIGGAETVAMNIYRHIDREKFECHYLVYGDEVGAYEQEVAALGGKVIHIDVKTTRNYSLYVKAMKQIVNENGPYEIVHAHMMFHNAIIMMAARSAGIPIRISHAHSTNDGEEKTDFFRSIVRWIYRTIARMVIRRTSDHFIGCGEKAGQFLYGKNFFDSHGILIRNGIDLDKYKFDELKGRQFRNQLNVGDKKIFICVGHLEKVKNHIFLLDVFTKIKEKSFVLYILGEGKLEGLLKDYVNRNNLNDHVIFTGNVNNVNEYMMAADCLLMPSLYEGVPVTLIEAQAASLRCVVSVQVASEVKLTDSIEFLPLEGDVWRNAIEKICNNKCLKKYSGYDLLKTKGYGVDKSIGEIELMYRGNLKI